MSFDGAFGTQPVVLPAVSSETAQTVAVAAIVPMVALTLALGFANDHLQRPLLVLFGVLVWFVTWQLANAPLAFDTGVRVASRPQRRALLAVAVTSLRGVAHRGAPRDGVGPGLERAAAAMPLPVQVRTGGLGRLPEALETTIYFCALEGLQNAVKHAGRGASITIDVGRRDGAVAFTVSDDGAGFDPEAAPRGAGLANLAHRVEAAGGSLAIDSRPGEGTRISGTLPV